MLRKLSEHDAFPRPGCAGDVIPCDDEEPSVAAARWLVLLTDATSEDWRFKVGPKSPTRLLFSSGLVFKTSHWRKHLDLDVMYPRVQESIRRMRRLSIWHPEKRFFIIRARGWYWPC